MNREKRTAQLKINVPPSLREEVKQLVEENGVISMSDYLFGIVEDHVDQTLRIKRRTIMRRTGTS